jgi:hypothetical protein
VAVPADRYLPETLAQNGFTVRVLSDADVDTLIAAGIPITESAKTRYLAGQRLIVPQAWADLLGAGPAPAPVSDGTTDTAGGQTVTNPYSGAASGESTSSGGGGNYDYGSSSGGSWSSRSGGYGDYYGGGSYGSDYGGNSYGTDYAADFAPPMDMGASEESTSGREPPFDSAIFGRYFQVLSQKYGPTRARMMMRGFSRRFGRSFGSRATGKRTMSSRTKTKGASVPTNAGFREPVTTQVAKQTGGKKAKAS